MNLRRAVTRHVTAEFLAWLAAERAYTVKLFRVASTLEDVLQDRWRREGFENAATLDELARAACIRQRIEAWLNILEFGAQYGVNFQSPERKRLFKRWLQNSTTHKN